MVLPMIDLKKKANLWAQKLGKSKHIEAIFLSGSIAQGKQNPEADIDFFIITKPDHIWRARWHTLITLKLHQQLAKPHNHAKKICPNHFITSDNLEINEKDAYAANLFSHNLPLYDPKRTFTKFRKANEWVENYGESFQYNSSPRKEEFLKTKNKNKSKLEFILKSLQIKKIKSNTEYKTPGAKIILTDTELRFHPNPKNKTWKK